jgi:hypothetical protein
VEQSLLVPSTLGVLVPVEALLCQLAHLSPAVPVALRYQQAQAQMAAEEQLTSKLVTASWATLEQPHKVEPSRFKQALSHPMLRAM